MNNYTSGQTEMHAIGLSPLCTFKGSFPIILGIESGWLDCKQDLAYEEVHASVEQSGI